MNTIVYLIQANLFLLLFYGFYVFFLRKETFNNLNRGYLVIAAVTAFAVPFLQSDLVRSWFVTQQVSEVIYTSYSPEMFVVAAASESSVLWIDILRFIYLSVVIILGIRLIINVLMTSRLFSNFSETVDGAFSFFGKIVVDENLEGRDTIYRHEEIHSKHLHSADVILFELIAIVCWFNPVVYFYRNAVRNIHEFIADELASRTVPDKAVYATLLFSQQFRISPSVLTNSFYKPATLKLRVEMLLKNRSKKTALMKYGLIAPLFLSMIVLASATVIDKKGLQSIAESVEVPLTELPSINDLSLLSIENDKQTSREIEGYVKNSDGEVVAGAIIIVKGSSVGTTTDRDGYFKLNVNDNNTTLIISFAGFETREIKIDGITEVTVKLVELQNMLNEMLVTGYASASNKGGASSEIFTRVENAPEFPSGVSEMYKFIGSQIRYPSDAQRANIQGKVFVKFVVQSDGEIGRIEILKGIGFGCEEEAVRVLAKMPKWKPGMQNGKPVAVYYTMPVAFRLEGGNDSEATKFPEGISVPPLPPPSISLNGTGTTIRGVVNKDGSKPLIVVDGVVSEEGKMNTLNPADISSVSVIKGEAATSLYGQQGKNGVIVITTKEASVLKANVYEMKEALYIVDGVEMSYEEYKKKYKKDASGSTTFIYKAGDAVEKFGQKGKNGVIVIKTKD